MDTFNLKTSAAYLCSIFFFPFKFSGCGLYPGVSNSQEIMEHGTYIQNMTTSKLCKLSSYHYLVPSALKHFPTSLQQHFIFTNMWWLVSSGTISCVRESLHICVSHHNDECSRAYEAPDKVGIQSQPAPTEIKMEREREDK